MDLTPCLLLLYEEPAKKSSTVKTTWIYFTFSALVSANHFTSDFEDQKKSLNLGIRIAVIAYKNQKSSSAPTVWECQDAVDINLFIFFKWECPYSDWKIIELCVCIFYAKTNWVTLQAQLLVWGVFMCVAKP